MFLPGMQYQDESWRHCKSALSWALLQTCRQCQTIAFTEREAWVAGIERHIWAALWPLRSRLLHHRNRDGQDGFELCQDLLLAWLTPAEPMRSEWWAKLDKTSASKGTAALPDDQLRKLCGDMWSQFRDEVDVQHYIAATGDDFSVNQLQNLRKVDMADRAVKTILLHWREQAGYTGRILGREIQAEPIEVARIKSGGRCAAQWLLNWSEHHATFHPKGKVGPFHTKSKRFTASIKNLDQMLGILDTRNGPWAGMGQIVSLDALLPILQQLEQEAVPAIGHSRLTPAPHEHTRASADLDGGSETEQAGELADVDTDFDTDGNTVDEEMALESGDADDDLTDIALLAPGKPSQDPAGVLGAWPLPVQLAAWLESARAAGVSTAVLKAFLAASDLPTEWGLRPERPGDFTLKRLRALVQPPMDTARFSAAVAAARLELSCYFAARGGKESDHD